MAVAEGKESQMIRKSFYLLALALAAAAVAAPLGQGQTNGTVLSSGYPQPKEGEGFSFKAPSYWNAGASYWTTAQGAAPIVVRSSINRSLGVPPQYLGTHQAAFAAPKVDPLAVSYLIGRGYTPSQVEAWTVGACSHEVKAAACFGPSKGANLTGGEAKVDPLAVSYLTGQGLSPSEVTSWTVGACSHETRAASCYAMFRPAATSFTQVTGSTGFQWGDAGVGAGFTLGIILLLGGVGAGLFISRRNGRHQPARA
jgi:hypothetical protein